MPKDFEIKNKFDSYIPLVIKQIHPGISTNAHTKISINKMLHDVAKRILANARLVNNQATLTSRDIQTGVKLTFDGELAKHGVAKGTRAVTKFTSSASGSRTNPVSKARRAGLAFPPSLAERIMREHGCKGRIGATAPVYLAAVLEYLSAEILELAGNRARDAGHKLITPRDLMLAIRGDDELNNLLTGVLNGGVVPHIHIALK